MTLTAQARKVIRESGLPHWGLWTNKYEKCRTVKAMVKSDATAGQLRAAKAQVLAAVPNATVKILISNGYYGSTGISFIVRVPIDY